MKVGRPLKYKTVEELQERIDLYFEEGANTRNVFTGGGVSKQKAYTITGFSLFLGFISRQSIYDYLKRNNEFSYAIQAGVTKIEMFYEENLTFAKSASGSIHWLNNHGWKDRKEVEQTTDMKVDIMKSLDLSKLSPETIKELMQALPNDDTSTD